MWLISFSCNLSVFIAITSRLSVSFGMAQRHWIEKVQTRLRVTSAMLADMKAVKMLGLSRSMVLVIQGLRADEIHTSRSYRKLLVAMILLGNYTLTYPQHQAHGH